jgi:NAD(P)-dependent dehydrogenase (short-subunit alcohol dehydrogenase family)
MTEPLRFDGKVVFITGGAGGLGAATGRLLSSRGASIAVVDISARRAEIVAAEIREGGGKAVGIVADITVEAQVKAAVDKTIESFGRLDVLVNNAMNAQKDIYEGDFYGITNLTEEVWQGHMAVNGLGAMFCCKYAIPEMLKVGGGSIVNIVSVAALKGGHAMAAYGSSKGALVSLTKHLAVAYGKQGIRANAIAPGTCLHNRNSSTISDEMMDTSSVLGTRLGSGEDIAYAVAFLASDQAGYITGQVLPVDGGGTVGKITAMPRPMPSQMAGA